METATKLEMTSLEGFPTEFKDKLLDKLKDIIDEKLDDLTNGNIKLESILKGQMSIDGSGYVDKALTQLSTKMESLSLDSVPLPELTTEFNKSFMCMAIPGVAKFSKGVLNGFTNFKRFGNSDISIDALGQKLITAKTCIGLEEVGFRCPSIINILCVDMDLLIKALLKDIQVSIELGVGRDFLVSLDKFEVKSTGKLTFFNDEENEETATGFSQDIIQSIQASLEEAIHDKIRDIFQKDVMNLLKELVAKLEFLI